MFTVIVDGLYWVYHGLLHYKHYISLISLYYMILYEAKVCFLNIICYIIVLAMYNIYIYIMYCVLQIRYVMVYLHGIYYTYMQIQL